MYSLDKIYQTAVNNETDKILKLPVSEFLNIGDYGNIESSITEKKIKITWFHYKLDGDIHHLVFLSDRRYFMFLHKKYLSGAKFENGKIVKLNDKELGLYD